MRKGKPSNSGDAQTNRPMIGFGGPTRTETDEGEDADEATERELPPQTHDIHNTQTEIKHKNGGKGKKKKVKRKERKGKKTD